MSDSVIFDQLSFVKRGVDVGVPREHAEWLAQEQTHLLENNLATKTDIELLRKDTAVELAKLETNLTKAIQASQFKIIGALGGLIAVFGLIIALTAFLRP